MRRELQGSADLQPLILDLNFWHRSFLTTIRRQLPHNHRVKNHAIRKNTPNFLSRLQNGGRTFLDVLLIIVIRIDVKKNIAG